MIIEFPTIGQASDNKIINALINALIQSDGLIALNGILFGLMCLLDSSKREKPSSDPGSNLATSTELTRELYNLASALPEHKRIAVDMILKLINDIID